MNKILLTTTGNLANVLIDDLGSREFIHPTINLDLLLEYDSEELLNSTDLQSAIDNNYITLTDELGNNISDINNFNYFKSLVTANDASSDYLINKIKSGSNISVDKIQQTDGSEYLEINTNSNIITSSFFYENTNTYSNKNKGLKEVFTTDSFTISSPGLYKIEITAEITNEDDDRGAEIYNYLDNDPNCLLLKIFGIAVEEMEYHPESNFVFKTLTSGMHSITVYLETTKNKKTAYMKNYQILISKV